MDQPRVCFPGKLSRSRWLVVGGRTGTGIFPQGGSVSRIPVLGPIRSVWVARLLESNQRISVPATNFSLPIRCYFSNEKYLYFTAVLDSGVRDELLPSYARSWNDRECGWWPRFFVFWRRSTGSTLNTPGPTDSDDSCN